MPSFHSLLISPEELQQLRAAGAPVMVFDCSFELSDPAAGPRMFAASHIPGAVYADLDHALSTHDPVHAVSAGRHPLPDRETFAAWLRHIGFHNGMQAVVYDRNGCNYCGRLWWMLQWMGHAAVAVLDGGLQGWESQGLPLASGEASAAPATSSDFVMQPALVSLASTEEVLAHLNAPDRRLVDSRGAPRYRGDVEPMDPVAGHIPGALNRPFSDNLGPDGRFKSPAQLREEFDALLGTDTALPVTVYCGSGVSATPNVLALALSGRPTPTLYAGSWSAWCTHQPPLPVARG